MNTAWRWFDLGRFRVLAMPLPLNPYWTTHRVFLDGKLVGKQLSVPTVDDCEWLLRHPDRYAEPSKHLNTYGYTALLRKRGRPTKAQSERELQEALAA
jgi:hypothetical protein